MRHPFICTLLFALGLLSITAGASSPEDGPRDAITGLQIAGAVSGVDSDLRRTVEHPDYWPVSLVPGGAGPIRLVPRSITVRPAAPGFCAPLDHRPAPSGAAVIAPAPTPASLPATIRVGRRLADTCSGNPVQRIDEIAFEDYVKGVVYAEIGVFQSVAGGPSAAAGSFKTFAIAARSYALYMYLRDPAAAYHIDDTACNQRYLDQRAAPINSAVDSVRAMVLVKSSDHGVIDSYEYAASCGRNGSRPEYQTAIVPDQTTAHACVGTWCGHDGCAGHEDNPDLPGTDRCLVRGICQWGSAERSMAGETFGEIVAHYQPNLAIVTLPYGGASDGGTPDAAVQDAGGATTALVGYVREDDIHTGAAVPGASVSLSTGVETVTDPGGYYAFEGLAAGTYTVTATAPGFDTQSDAKTVDTAVNPNWKSIALHRLDGGTADVPTPDAASTDGSAPDDGAPDAGAIDAQIGTDVDPCGTGTHLEGGACVLEDTDAGRAVDASAGALSGGEGGCSCSVLSLRR